MLQASRSFGEGQGMSSVDRRKYRNTAGRLFEIFSAALTHRGVRVRTAWAGIFGIDENDSNAIILNLVQLHMGLNEVEGEIKATHKFPDLLLREFAVLRNACLPINLDSGFQGIANTLQPPVIRSLEMCADALPEEGEITKDEITAVYDEVNNLFLEVEKSTLNNHLKRAILELLAGVKRLMDEYRVRGPKAFKEALTRLAGEIVLHPAEFKTIEEEQKGVFERFNSLLAKLATLAERAEKVGRLLEYSGPVSDWIQNLLQGPGLA